MSGYAASTPVPVERTRAEIERTLARWGATAFAYGWQEGRAVLSFAAQDRCVHFELPLPQPDERRFTHTAGGRRRAAAQAQMEYEQGVRARCCRCCASPPVRRRWRSGRARDPLLRLPPRSS